MLGAGVKRDARGIATADNECRIGDRTQLLVGLIDVSVIQVVISN
jgi:hypothetical protein